MKYWEWEDELGQKYKEGISNCDVFFGIFFSFFSVWKYELDIWLRSTEKMCMMWYYYRVKLMTSHIGFEIRTMNFEVL